MRDARWCTRKVRHNWQKTAPFVSNPEKPPSQYSRLSRSIVRISDDLAFPFVSMNRETGGWFSRGVVLSTQQRVGNPTLTAVACPVVVTLDERIVSRIDPIRSSVESNSRGTSTVKDKVADRARSVFASASWDKKNYLWNKRPNSSGVRRQLNLPDCRRTLESVSGSPFGSRFADSRLRGFVRASRGRRFLSVHAAHSAPSFAPTLSPFSPPSSPFHLFKTRLFVSLLLSPLCLFCVTGRVTIK